MDHEFADRYRWKASCERHTSRCSLLGNSSRGDDCSASDVSTRYDIPVAAVEAAVEYYHNHPELMDSIERQRENLLEEAERNPRVPTTPEELSTFATESPSASD